VAYFHENQITYPDSRRDPRDIHFGLTNMTTALAAQPWFNSAFGRDAFLTGLTEVLGTMPDHPSTGSIDSIRTRSRVLPPGIDPFPSRGPRRPGPLRIAWAARWEHDKNPEAFFDAVGQLADRPVEFRLSVLGEQFNESPTVFETAGDAFSEHVDHWGFLPRAEYLAALGEADVIVSTAMHEFFGVSIVEAAAAGAMPVLPNRLAYPEVFSLGRVEGADDLFYDGSTAGLTAKLIDLADRLAAGGTVWRSDPALARDMVAPLQWPRHAPVLDDALDVAAADSP
jgi:glycosyltransferase involved in cell wall biosynthesis